MPSATRLAAVTAVLGVLGGLGAAAGGSAVRGQEWWLGSLHLAQAWQASRGAGVTVAVLGTGVAADHPDLAGTVITGPDYSGSGRAPGGPYWGVEGTAVAGVISGHGHGPGGQDGIIGVAPAAKILSIRVTLEYNDPLNSDPALAHRLPGAIAEGIRYAVDHGARVIDLPLDPGTLGLTGRGDPAAAGGSAAERAAVGYALGRNVVLVAPAGDDGFGPAIVDYPAAYPGVIAVGAVGRNGRLASFTSRRPYVSLTAPGAGLVAAAPPDGYASISTTCMSSGIVAGVAALIVSRYPQLTVAQVTRALVGSTAVASGGTAATEGTATSPPTSPPPFSRARSAAGAGYGTVDAARAVHLAALTVAATRPRRPAPPPARHHTAARPFAASTPTASGSALAGSVLRDALAAVGALIALLVAGLVLMSRRRRRSTPPAAPAAPGARAAGAHVRGTGGPGGASAPLLHEAASGHQAATTGPAAAARWSVPGSGYGSSLAGLASPPNLPRRPAITPIPKRVSGRAGGGSPGPPWEPAAEPETEGLPASQYSPDPPGPESGAAAIRVPGDMTAPPAAPWDLAPPPVPGFTAPPSAGFPAKRNLEFAAAPVPGDHAGPNPDDLTPPGPGADSVWDLTATDVFPVVGNPGGLAEPPGPAEPPDDGTLPPAGESPDPRGWRAGWLLAADPTPVLCVAAGRHSAPLPGNPPLYSPASSPPRSLRLPGVASVGA